MWINTSYIPSPHTLLVEVPTCLSTKYTSLWTQSTATEPRETPTGRVKSEVKPKVGVGMWRGRKEGGREEEVGPNVSSGLLKTVMFKI